MRQSQWLGIICPHPPDWDRVNLSENLGKAAALKFIYSEKATNLHRRVDRYYSTNRYYIGQIYDEDFTKMCSLLRKYELYHWLRPCYFNCTSTHILKMKELDAHRMLICFIYVLTYFQAKLSYIICNLFSFAVKQSNR